MKPIITFLGKHKNILPLYAVGFLLLLLFKVYYHHADATQLRFLLAPVTKLVSLLSGIPFQWESRAGYVNHDLRFIIAPSCSGMQFMMITFVTLFFSSLPNMPKQKNFFWHLFISLFVAYFYTIPVNTLRILLALTLPALFYKTGILYYLLNPDTLHTLIGTVVYFSALFSLSRLVQKKVRPKDIPQSTFLSNYITPLFWYLGLVLGIPFLTRSLRQDFNGFFEYALLVILSCSFILLIHYLTHKKSSFSFRKNAN